MKKYFYVAVNRETNTKDFEITEFADTSITENVIRAIDTVFYLNKTCQGITLDYGFTNLEKDELIVELNK